MSSDSRTLSCHDFQEQLPELIGSEELQNHPHYVSCERCRALMADLESIAEAARQLLPVVDPPEALWEQIERAILEKARNGASQELDAREAEASSGP